MEGFKLSPELSGFTDALNKTGNTKEFEQTIKKIRKQFKTCDIYIAKMSEAHDRYYISFGVKPIARQKASRCIFRLYPSINQLTTADHLSLTINAGTGRRFNAINESVNLDSIKVNSGTKHKYRIPLYEKGVIEEFLTKLSACDLIKKEMSGGSNLPDSYFFSDEDDTKYQQEIQTKNPNDKLVKDKPMKRKEPLAKKGKVQYDRNKDYARIELKRSGYLCELGKNTKTPGRHQTFISESSKENYVEAHHLIPLSQHYNYAYSLDVPANIVPLCPTCHRKLHHGVYSELTDELALLFKLRKNRLKDAGLGISLQSLINAYQ